MPSTTAGDGSRIVRSMREDDSIAMAAPAAAEDAQNRWLARARSNVQVMYRTSLAVSHTLDIDELLGRILQLVFEWVEADRGCIMLLDPESRELRTKARRDRKAGDAATMPISRTILDYVLDHARRRAHERRAGRRPFQRRATASCARACARRSACPCAGRYDTVGVIYVDTTVP